MNITNQDYQTLAPELYRFVSYRLNSAADAEDVVSTAFMKLLNETQDVTNPKAWLYTVARNIIYDKYKKAARETELNEEVVEFTVDKADAEKQIIDELMLEQVKTHLQKLDEVTQEIIVLRIWEEFSFAEIAEVLQQKEDTVKKRFYRGIEKLKEMMEEAGVKRRAIALPIIIAGLTQLAKDPGYQMSATFSNNLFNSLKIMPEVQTVSAMTKLKLFLASKWGMALLCFLGISAIALIALLIALISNNSGGNGNGNTSTSATASVFTSTAVSSELSSSTATASADPYAGWTSHRFVITSGLTATTMRQTEYTFKMPAGSTVRDATANVGAYKELIGSDWNLKISEFHEYFNRDASNYLNVGTHPQYGLLYRVRGDDFPNGEGAYYVTADNFYTDTASCGGPGPGTIPCATLVINSGEGENRMVFAATCNGNRATCDQVIMSLTTHRI